MDVCTWDGHRSVDVYTENGIRKRRRPYVAHLSRTAFGELKRKHRGAALERAIAELIEGAAGFNWRRVGEFAGSCTSSAAVFRCKERFAQ